MMRPCASPLSPDGSYLHLQDFAQVQQSGPWRLFSCPFVLNISSSAGASSFCPCFPTVSLPLEIGPHEHLSVPISQATRTCAQHRHFIHVSGRARCARRPRCSQVVMFTALSFPTLSIYSEIVFPYAQHYEDHIK